MEIKYPVPEKAPNDKQSLLNMSYEELKAKKDELKRQGLSIEEFDKYAEKYGDI